MEVVAKKSLYLRGLQAAYSGVLEVIDDEHEYGCKEIDGMYDGKRQVELRRCYDQPMNDDYDVSLENIPKIDVVFVVETHVVVPDDCKIENH